MMYLPCPLAEGFGHGGYYIGDDQYRSISQQEDMRVLRQENQIVHNAKLDHLISLKSETTPGQQHK
jgi:hypothetical protein